MKISEKQRFIKSNKVSDSTGTQLIDNQLNNKEIDKYIRNLGIAKFYEDITTHEVDKMILDIEGLKIVDLLMIVDRICALVKGNQTKVTFVTNKINALFEEIKTKELDNILILQGVCEWFAASELDNSDVGLQQIFSFIHDCQVHYLSSYYLFGYHRVDLQPFNDYLNSTWMGEFMRKNAEVVVLEKTNTDVPIQVSQFDIRRSEMIFPTIDCEKYDVNLIYKICNRKVFQCNRNTFDSFLVKGIGTTNKMKWLDSKWGCKAQLRAFINEITSQFVKPKPINLMFNCIIDSDTTVGKLNTEIILLLRSCKTRKV